MAGFKFYKGRDGLLSSEMCFMFGGAVSGYNDPSKKGLTWKSTDGTLLNVAGIGANNNYNNALPANPYICLDTPIVTNSEYFYDDYTATSNGLTITASSVSSSTDDIGYSTVSMKISNTTNSAISFNCIKFLKTCACSYGSTYKGNKTTLVFGYFLDSPYEVASGDSVDVVFKLKAY